MAKPRSEMSIEDLQAARQKDRDRAYTKRVGEAAAALFERIKHQGNFLLRETVGSHVRYTFADRSGGPVRADHAEALIAHERVSLIKEDGPCQTYGVR